VKDIARRSKCKRRQQRHLKEAFANNDAGGLFATQMKKKKKKEHKQKRWRRETGSHC